jgi:hypothetical protein
VSCAEVRDLIPLLALDATEVDERDRVDDHLARCDECAAEYAAYLDTAAHLALALPQQEPPTRLRTRLLTVAQTGRRESARGASWWSRLGFGLPRLQPATLVAALALAVALGTSFWAVGLESQLTEQRALAASLRERANRYDRVVAVLQSQNIQLRAMEGTQLAPAATGRVYVDPETCAGMLMVRSLPPLPEGRVYQLWWARTDGTRESGGTLSWTDPRGNSYGFVQCPGAFASWQGIGITEEPSGGSPVPTGQRLLAGTI